MTSFAAPTQRIQTSYFHACSWEAMQTVGQAANLYCATKIIEGLALLQAAYRIQSSYSHGVPSIMEDMQTVGQAANSSMELIEELALEEPPTERTQSYIPDVSCSMDAMQTVEQAANSGTELIEGLALAMLMTQVSLRAEQLSLEGTRKEIESIDQKSGKIRDSRMKSAEKANKTEKACKRWSVMTKVFSWLTTATTIVAGIALIATGAGTAAGSLLLISGILAITNHLLEITGSWNKIAEKLHTDPAKSRSIIMWLQVAILSVSVVLAGAGAIFGGISAMQEAIKTAGNVFSGVANAGVGTLMISIAILNRDYFNRLAEIKRYEKHLEELRQDRKDQVDNFEGHVEECENIHSLLTRMLKMHNQTSKLILRHIKR